MSKLPTAQNGKGSKPRPFTDKKTFDDNWDRIFGKKKDEPKDEKVLTDNSTSV